MDCRYKAMLLLGAGALLVSFGCNDSPYGGEKYIVPDQAADEPAEPKRADAKPEDVPTDTAATTEPEPATDKGVISFQPGPDAQKQVMEELILAEPGAVFQFEEGVFDFTDGLSLTVENVTIRGRGMDKTVLKFKGQEAGAEGLYITSNKVTVEDLAIEDTKGNAIKSLKADDIVFRRVRTEWTGGPLATNGAYGIYPVSSNNVLVEECVAIGASDAGIYVGQSKNVIVRNCRAAFNVAGIEIENCHGADVYGNEATNNTGGILVFDLPDLPQQKGHDVRVFKNKIFDNNTENFAPKGNMVGTVPTGTGVMVMANSNVEIFENDIRDHGTINTLLVSYLVANVEIKDANYYPYAERIHVHDNTFGSCGDKPAGLGGMLIKAVLRTQIPDVVWDGVYNETKMVDGKLDPEVGISVRNNTKEDGEVTFANLGGTAAMKDPENAKPDREIANYAEVFPPIAPVVIPGVN
jgi:parallel beta-helix repeat protein